MASEADVLALEARAEAVASKVPGFAAMPVAAPPEPPASRKVQITAYLPMDVRDDLRQAAVALAGPPHMETVTSIVERAIRRELERLHEEYGDFPATNAKPRPGRRAG